MPGREIKPGIYWVGVNDRTTDLFEGIWPITKEGVSYNSYLIKDEKTAIIDLTRSLMSDEYFSQLDEFINITDVDYVVLNHMEPDHSGIIRTLRRIAPQVKILGSSKTKEMLEKFFSISDNVQVVEDGDMLSLGKRKLKFFSTPFVHWPETIMTYEIDDQILFPCDAFGSYGAIHSAIFDDECKNPDFYQKEALRYYVNIVANFSARVLSAIEKLAGVPLRIIAPSHGLIWRKDISRIVNLYKKWAEYAKGQVETGITLVYGSMYGNTEIMMNSVAQGISSEGVHVDIFDASRTHVSYILPSLWIKQGVVIGAPTYEVSLFPPVAEVLRMAQHKHIKNRKAAFFGSYGWSGGALKEMKSITGSLNWELLEAYEFIGSPSSDDLKKAKRFGSRFARAVKEKG